MDWAFIWKKWDIPVLEGVFKYVFPFFVIAFSYMRFYMGKIYTPRLEVTVEAKVVERDGKEILLVTSKAKNTGNRRVYLKGDGGWAKISICKPFHSIPAVEDSEWEDGRTVSLFGENKYIDTGEVMQDSLLVCIPRPLAPALKIDVEIKAKSYWESRTWLHQSIKTWLRNNDLIGDKMWAGSTLVVPNGVTI